MQEKEKPSVWMGRVEAGAGAKTELGDVGTRGWCVTSVDGLL